MILGRIYTTKLFNAVEPTEAMLTNILATNVPEFDHYGARGPFETRLDIDALEEPSKRFSGYPTHTDGQLFLGSQRDTAVMDLNFRVDDIAEWLFTSNNALFRQADWVSELIEFFTDFCHKNDVLYAGVDHHDAWVRRRDMADSVDGVPELLRHRAQLPGIYWFTYFGPMVFEQLQSDAVLSSVVGREVGSELEGVALTLSESPLDVDRNKREAATLVQELGEEYFFDPSTDDTSTIPFLRDVHETLKARTERASTIPYLPPEDAELFEREIHSIDGEIFVDTEDLASVLVVYLDEDVEGMSGYDRSVLENLDEYFQSNPQRRLYNQVHLKNELIPALGAYLGEVFVKEMGVRWTDGDTITTRTLTCEKVEPRDISPFHLAYHVIYHDMKITDFYGYLDENC